jgi:hypothetical protein
MVALEERKDTMWWLFFAGAFSFLINLVPSANDLNYNLVINTIAGKNGYLMFMGLIASTVLDFLLPSARNGKLIGLGFLLLLLFIVVGYATKWKPSFYSLITILLASGYLYKAKQEVFSI